MVCHKRHSLREPYVLLGATHFYAPSTLRHGVCGSQPVVGDMPMIILTTFFVLRLFLPFCFFSRTLFRRLRGSLVGKGGWDGNVMICTISLLLVKYEQLRPITYFIYMFTARSSLSHSTPCKLDFIVVLHLRLLFFVNDTCAYFVWGPLMPSCVSGLAKFRSTHA